MTGLKTMGNGRYKCLFCSHTSYKQMAAALTHVQGKHELELANATIEEMRGALERANNKPPKIEVREKVVYRDPPAPAKSEKKFWSVPGLYCSNCKTAQQGGGIPIGQTVEDTPHSICGTKSLMLILEF